MLKTQLIFLLSSALAFPSSTGSPQTAATSSDLPTFEVATIKPPVPGASRRLGFYGQPGGRVFFGGTVWMLVLFAFDIQDYQLAGDRNGTISQWFEIKAVPPENSPPRQIKVPNVEPTSDQRLMLQALLRDRFGFKYHIETKEGDVYVLTRGNKPLQLKPPKDPAADPRAIVVIKQGGIVDGEAEGINTTTDYLAQRLSRYLRLPVQNETKIAGSYDYYLPPDDPGNQDIVTGVIRVVDRLGLKLKHGRGPIKTLVIDHVQQPSEN